MADPTSFLGEPPASDDAEAIFDADRDEEGYVQNVTRLWSWRPDLYSSFFQLRGRLMEASGLSDRELAVIVTATVAELSDSYCSLAWGTRLAKLGGNEAAAQVIAGAAAPTLTAREAALAAWARQVVRDPNGTTEADVETLRGAGLDDREIFEATTLVAFRLAFSTVNDALGAAPDKQLADAAPDAVRAAVAYGRPPAAAPSGA